MLFVILGATADDMDGFFSGENGELAEVAGESPVAFRVVNLVRCLESC